MVCVNYVCAVRDGQRLGCEERKGKNEHVQSSVRVRVKGCSETHAMPYRAKLTNTRAPEGPKRAGPRPFTYAPNAPGRRLELAMTSLLLRAFVSLPSTDRPTDTHAVLPWPQQSPRYPNRSPNPRFPSSHQSISRHARASTVASIDSTHPINRTAGPCDDSLAFGLA